MHVTINIFGAVQRVVKQAHTNTTSTQPPPLPTRARMRRADLLRTYAVTADGGTITTPGPFKGQPLYAPYFWQLVCTGQCNLLTPDTASVPVLPEDLAEFPELDPAHYVEVKMRGWSVEVSRFVTPELISDDDVKEF